MPTTLSQLETARQHIQTLEDMNRNAQSALMGARSERDEARTQRDEARKQMIENADNAAKFAEASNAEAQRQRQHIRRLFNSIFHLNIDLARKAGYIDRVKECDAKTEPTTVIEPDMFNIDSARDDLARARSSNMVDKVIDGMDPEILDQVLGREPDSDLYRG